MNTAMSHNVSQSPFQIEWGIRGAQELINIHPLFVHFPIGLLLAASFFYFAGWIFRKEELFLAGKWTLFLGTLSTALAVWTGLQAAKTVSHGGDVHSVMMMHQYLGFAISGLSIVLSLGIIFKKKNIPSPKILFLFWLLILSVIIVQQTDLGGRMVFLNGVGVGKKSMQGESETHLHDHEHTEHHQHG